MFHRHAPHRLGSATSGAGRVNQTLVREVQALCTVTVLDQQVLELVRRFERRSRTYEARALPTELHQRENFGGGGENCTPDDLLCRQMPCCLGYTASYLERSTGIAPVLPDWRSGVLLLYELRAWSEQRELNSRHRVGGPRHQPLYHARNGGR